MVRVKGLRPVSIGLLQRPRIISTVHSVPNPDNLVSQMNNEAEIEEVTFRPEMENSVQMVGFLAKDPEFIEFKTGTIKTELVLGMKERRTKRNQWFEVAIWGPLAHTVCKQFHKGSEVYIHGKLEQSSWTDSKTGKNRSKVTIVAKSVHRLKYPNSVPYPIPR
eukprot:g5694.t1